MGQCDSDIPLFWQTGVKQIPPRPDNPARYPTDDARHWYDTEYAGWTVSKNPQPESPGDGPRGKTVVAITAGNHPYTEEFRRGMRAAAERNGIILQSLVSDWEPENQIRDVERAISLEPDLIILWIESVETGNSLIDRIYKAGIPVIAANTMPDEVGLKNVLAWTGPDDWAQFRLLSRRFADLMDYSGGYAIISHMEGSSAYYARSWSAITELKAVAPEMKLLAIACTNLEEDVSYTRVMHWIREFGDRLKGIVSADDDLVQKGINRALEETGRSDIVRVANGSTDTGINLVKNGKLDAITYQLADRDGALPIKVAADWFHGLEIPPLRHLPVRILDRDNIAILENRNEIVPYIDTEELYQDVLDCKTEAVKAFFDQVIYGFTRNTQVSMEFFRGFSIELYSNLHHLIRSASLDEGGIVGNYEDIYKNLFQQTSMVRTMGWLRDVSLAIIRRLENRRNRHRNLVSQVVDYVQDHLDEPHSLKTISYRFNITAPYLGKLFTDDKGDTFSNWLNRIRIVKAIELMKTSDLSVKEIAGKVGYANPNYFYKIFKKYEGINPGEFQAGLSGR